MTHICVSKLPIIGSDNGLAPGRRQTIIWTKDGLLLIGPLGTNFSEILIGIQTFSFKKMHLKMSSAKWRPFCLGHNVLSNVPWSCIIPLINVSHTYCIKIVAGLQLCPVKRNSSYTKITAAFKQFNSLSFLATWRIIVFSRAQLMSIGTWHNPHQNNKWWYYNTT